MHYLVAHVVGGNRFASMLLNGMTGSAAMDAVMSQTQLAEDPVRNYRESSEAQRAAFASPGALDATVSHPLGDMPGARFLGMRTFDITLHAWDLATALGVDATIDEALVDHVLGIMTKEPPGMGFGIEARPLDDDVTPLDRMLSKVGRSSHPGL